ncbi:MATE family efflux transporter [Lacrimispora sp. 38-1]
MNKKLHTTQVIMTEGVIWRQLLAFSLPLLVGNLFQQLYNTVDSVVVGNFIGSDALAAVGSSNSLINLIIGMFMGIGTGAGVIISQYYGAGEKQKLHWAVHTTMALSIVGGLILIVLGVFLSPLILVLMGTPQSVMPASAAYLRIFFCGSLFNLVYNMGSGVLRAVGDSKRPLIFLCISSVINIVLDLAFVVVFQMGTAGVGYATVAAQGVSALLTVRALVQTDDSYRLELSKIKIDRRMMARVLKIGIPSGIQQSIISLSNVIVQANVNSFGAAAMAGFGSYSKIDGFAMLPLQSFCMAATTFTGQNIGAKKTRRVKQGVFQGLVISMIYTILISVILYLNAERILRIFSPDQDVIAYGYTSMLILLPFYWTMAIHQILMGSIRGSGRTMVTMLIGVGNMCILRMIYINLLVPLFPSFEAVMWCYPITWLTTMGMDCIYAWKAKWIPKGKEEQIGEKSQ